MRSQCPFAVLSNTNSASKTKMKMAELNDDVSVLDSCTLHSRTDRETWRSSLLTEANPTLPHFLIMVRFSSLQNRIYSNVYQKEEMSGH